jgi:hypothetical protein
MAIVVHSKLFPCLFGKQDLIQEAVLSILEIENLTIDESKVNAVLEKQIKPKLLNFKSFR